MKLNAFETSGTSPTRRTCGTVRSRSSAVLSNSNSSVKRITGPKADGLESSPSMTKSHRNEFSGSGTSPTVDLYFEGHGSIVLIRPVSPAGQNFLDEKVGDSETQTWGGAVVCEPRFCAAIAEGAIEAGLEVRGW